MKAAKVIGRIVCTHKDSRVAGKKILLLKPLSWEETFSAYKSGWKDESPDRKSIIALDAVGAGAGEYVFYVSSKEACQAFPDEPVCHNAIVGILDGITMQKTDNR